MSKLTATLYAALWIVSGMCTTPEPADESPNQLIEAGRRFYDAGDYQEAAKRFRAAVQADPSFLIGWENLAWAYRRLERFDEAIGICQNLLRVKADEQRYLNLLGGTLLDAGKPEAAEKAYRKSVAIDPQRSAARLGLARSLIALKRYAEALEEASQVIVTTPENLDAHISASEALLALQQTEKAIEMLKQAVVRHPKEPKLKRRLSRALNERGVKQFQRGKYVEAFMDFRSALGYDPEFVRAKMNLAWALDRQDRNEDSLEVWMSLKESHPQNSQVRNQIGQLYAKMGRFREAAAAYESSLEIDPNQPAIRLAVAKVKGWNRDYDEAIERLLSFLEEQPDNIELDRYLGVFLFEARRYVEAIPYLERYLAASPEDQTVAFRAASSLYACEEYDSAIVLLHGLYRDDPADVLSRLALAENAASQERFDESLRYLTEILAQDPTHKGAFNKLVAYGSKADRHDVVVEAASAFLEAAPNDPYALLPRADASRLLGRYNEAAEDYLRVLRANPSCVRAMGGLAELRIETQEYQKALGIAEQMIEENPSDVSLRFRLSRVLSAGGDFGGAVEVLKPMADESCSMCIPILLYHGLTRREREPVLHLENFGSQMKALHEAGYETIDSFELREILAGQKDPPPKLIVITFDDALHDSLQLADPILKHLGMKAVMSVPVAQVNSRHPVFASWEELEKWRRTGRWDIQAHGDRSHIEIPVARDGRTSRFMVNLRWIEKEGRLETPEKFRSRLVEDHQSCIRTIEQHVSTQVHAYAVPLGDYGHETPTNYGDAATTNLELIRKFYDLSFSQNPDGFNLLSADPHRLVRLNVPSDWDGQDLLRHLKANNPRAKALLWMGRNYSWAGKYRQALHSFDLAREGGADEFSVLLNESLTHKWMGAFEKSRRESEEARKLEDDNPDLNRHILELKKRTRPSWLSNFEFFADSEDRSRYSLTQSLSAYLRPDIEAVIGAQKIWLDEEGRADVEALMSFLSLRKQWTYRHQLRASVLSYRLQGRGDEWGYEFAYWAPLTDLDTLSFVSTKRILDSVRAVEEDIQATMNIVRWSRRLSDSLSTRAMVDRRDYTDGNYRWTFRGRLEWLCREAPDLAVSGEMLYSDTNHDVREYYTPQELFAGKAYVDLKGKMGSALHYSLGCSVGYGTDEIEGGRLIASVGAGLRYAIRENAEITMDAYYSRVPSYEWGTGRLGVQVRF